MGAITSSQRSLRGVWKYYLPRVKGVDCLEDGYPITNKDLDEACEEQGVEVRQLGARFGLAGLRLLGDPLTALLDVIAVGDQKLEAKRLEVGCGIRLRAVAVDDGKQREIGRAHV